MARTARFRVIAFFSASDRVLVVWEQLRTLCLFQGAPLGGTVRCCGKVIPTCGLLGGGL